MALNLLLMSCFVTHMFLVININIDVEFSLVVISVMQMSNFLNLQHLFVPNLNQVSHLQNSKLLSVQRTSKIMGNKGII